MEERDFFDEKAEKKTHVMTCPHCGQQGEYQIEWVVRRKKAQLPRGADDRDRARFAKAQSYMVRRDEPMGCKNVRCRKRFDVVGIQSVAFI
jgi:sarcosine oxidase delta subunit